MSTATAALQSDDSQDGILAHIFPRQIGNNFQGYRLSIWLFGFYVLVKAAQGTVSVFNTASTATRADGIPLDSFGTAASQTVISMFALLGLNVTVLPLLGVLALIRYRAMIPLLYLTMLVLNLSSRVVLALYPSPRIGGVAPTGFYVNLGLLAILLVGFFLSLMNPSKSAGREA